VRPVLVAAVPDLFSSISPWLNWATVFTGAAAAVLPRAVTRLSPPVCGAFALVLLVTQWLSMAPWPLWVTSLAIFVVAWSASSLGMRLEGKRPSFFRMSNSADDRAACGCAAAYRRNMGTQLLEHVGLVQHLQQLRFAVRRPVGDR